MSNIEDFAQNEKDLHDLETLWQDYRESVNHGIAGVPEIQLRNMHGRFAMLSAHAEMRAAQARANESREKNNVNVTEKRLLALTYKTGAMNSRLAQVANDETFKQSNDDYETAKFQTIIEEGKAKAAQIVLNSLSREMGKYARL